MSDNPADHPTACKLFERLGDFITKHLPRICSDHGHEPETSSSCDFLKFWCDITLCLKIILYHDPNLPVHLVSFELMCCLFVDVGISIMMLLYLSWEKEALRPVFLFLSLSNPLSSGYILHTNFTSCSDFSQLCKVLPFPSIITPMDVPWISKPCRKIVFPDEVTQYQ